MRFQGRREAPKHLHPIDAATVAAAPTDANRPAVRVRRGLDARAVDGLRILAWMVGDLGACMLGIGLISWIGAPDRFLARALMSVAFWIAGLAVAGAYSPRRCETSKEEIRRVLTGALAGAIVASAILGSGAATPVFTLTVIVLGVAGLSRIAIRIIFGRLYDSGVGVKRAVLIGRGEMAADATARMTKFRRLRIVGYVGDGVESLDRLSGVDGLGRAVVSSGAEVVVVVPNGLTTSELEIVLAELDHLPVQVRIVPGVPRVHHARMHVSSLGELSVVSVERPGFSFWQRFVKRAMDVAGSTVALLLLSPVFLLIALAIVVDSGFPVFYRQRRVGARGVSFEVLKFRTMVPDADQKVSLLQQQNEMDGVLFKIRNDPRITRVGRILRKFSVDEFPQFWNILRGDMSLVGPRPPLQEEVDQYDRFLARRLNVKPGATGIWQISGRNDLPFEDYVRYDLSYVENWSIGLDLSIMFKTVPVLLFGKGAY